MSEDRDIEQKQGLYYDEFEMYHLKNSIKLLVIGDSNIGKTTFLEKLCNDTFEQDIQEEKIQKTYGCDLHLFGFMSDYNQLMKCQNKLTSRVIQKSDVQEKYIEFWDISGDKNSRQFITVYTNQQMSNFKAVLFFFDTTNLKTLENIYKWIKAVFYNENSDKIYGRLWQLPFMIIGTKVEYFNDNKTELERMKIQVFKILQGLFSCSPQENCLFFSKNDKIETSLNFQIFQSFLNEIYMEIELEKEINKKNQNGPVQIQVQTNTNSEYEKPAINQHILQDTQQYLISIQQEPLKFALVCQQGSLAEMSLYLNSKIMGVLRQIWKLTDVFKSLQKSPEQNLNQQSV